MPHGESWFSVLFPTLYGNVESLLAAYHPEGTWIEHAHVGAQPVFGAVFAMMLVIVFAAIAFAKVRDTKAALIPEGRLTATTFMELVVEAIYGMLRDQMGAKAARFFLPLIGTCAFFILFSNVLGLIPGFLPPTDNLNITLACGVIIFLSTHIFGLKEHGLAYLKHFLGPVWWLAPLMLIIELVSHFVRPLSLGIRLMANMTADHMVLTIFIGLVPFIVPVPMYLLGSIVVVVQTLVFCLLSTVYISMAIAHEEH
jgi:F-type H+-transporting ATPase subunit a